MIDPKYRIGNVAKPKPREALVRGDAVYVATKPPAGPGEELFGCNGVIVTFEDVDVVHVRALTLAGKPWLEGTVPLSCLEHQTHPDIVAAVAAYNAEGP